MFDRVIKMYGSKIPDTIYRLPNETEADYDIRMSFLRDD